jgi:hypothetical protein
MDLSSPYIKLFVNSHNVRYKKRVYSRKLNTDITIFLIKNKKAEDKRLRLFFPNLTYEKKSCTFWVLIQPNPLQMSCLWLKYFSVEIRVFQKTQIYLRHLSNGLERRQRLISLQDR